MSDDAKTIEELQVEFVGLAGQLVAIENRRAEILATIDRRKARASADVLLAGKTDAEKDALRVALANGRG